MFFLISTLFSVDAHAQREFSGAANPAGCPPNATPAIRCIPWGRDTRSIGTQYMPTAEQALRAKQEQKRRVEEEEARKERERQAAIERSRVENEYRENQRRHDRWLAQENARVLANINSRTVSHGTAIPLQHAALYKGAILGAGDNWGECATGVQMVFNAANAPLGPVDDWKPGSPVAGNEIVPGTAIATFKDGKYEGHSAIFIEQTAEGIRVWEQWAFRYTQSGTIRRSAQPWTNTRLVKFKKKPKTEGDIGNDVNDGYSYRVVLK